MDSEGKPYKYLAIRSDITEQKNHTEELKVKEEKYRGLFQNSMVSML